jgi:hypothetical protein
LRQTTKTVTVTFTEFAGLGRTAAGTSYAHYGWFKDGNSGWWTLAEGSTHDGGCDGDEMPQGSSPQRRQEKSCPRRHCTSPLRIAKPTRSPLSPTPAGDAQEC